MTLSAAGVNVQAAVAKAATWGTAVACGADTGILINPHTLKRTRQALIDDSLGQYFPQNAVNAQIKCEGDIPGYLRYDGLDLLIALAMGASAAPTQLGTSTAYQQTYEMADGLDGLFATFVVNNSINIDEYTSVKVTGFNLKGQVGKPLEIKFHVLASDRLVNSTVNTATTFGGVTFFETANRVLFSQSAFLMNNTVDVALTSADQVYPDSFELEFKRKLAGKYGVGADIDIIDEPSNDGMPEITLKLEFPRYQSGQYFLDWDPMTQQKLQIGFTGAPIATGYNRNFQLMFPALQLSNVELPMAKGILKHPLQFNCLATATAPAGMSGITMPFLIYMTNRQSTNVLV